MRLYRRTVTAPGTRGGQKQVGKALEGWGVLDSWLRHLRRSEIVAEQNNKAVVRVTRPACRATRLSIRIASHINYCALAANLNSRKKCPPGSKCCCSRFSAWPLLGPAQGSSSFRRRKKKKKKELRSVSRINDRVALPSYIHFSSQPRDTTSWTNMPI